MIKQKGSAFNIIVCILLIVLGKGQLKDMDYFKAKKYSLFNGNNTVKYNQNGGYNTQVAWISSIPNIAKYALSFAAFSMFDSYSMLSFQAALGNVTATGGVINFNPMDSHIGLADFYVLIITNQANDYIDLINSHSICVNLRNSSRTNSQEYFNVSSTFVLDNSSNFIITHQYSCFVFKSVPGGQIQQLFSGSPIINVGSHQITFWFSSDWGTLVTSIDFVVSVASKMQIKSPLLSQLIFNAINSTNSIQSNMGINLTFGNANEGNCFMGINYIYFDTSLSNRQISFVQNSNIIVSLNFKNLSMINLEGYCFRLFECVDNKTTFDPNSTSLVCILCNNFISGCETCADNLNCTSCLSQYFFEDYRTCTSCSTAIYNCKQCLDNQNCTSCFFGRLVEGGCTQVTGCIKVSNSTCIACLSQYLLEGEKCVCDGGGWLITGYCTTNYGCLSLRKVNQKISCTSCNRQSRFVLGSDGMCECSNSLILVGSKCMDLCGNSRVIMEECDDGNNDNGDGCSSICQVEDKYICENGTQTHESNCVYVSNDLSITSITIDKNLNLNQAIIVLTINPALSCFSKMNLSAYFQFATAQNSVLNKITYENGAFTFLVDYTQELQGKAAQINLSFNKSLIIHKQINLNITMNSRGALLLVQNQYSKIFTMKYFNITNCSCIMFIFFFSFFLHKMIGVEILNTFQIIYLLQYITPYYTTPISIFQVFTLATANFQFIFNANNNLYSKQQQMRIPYNIYNQFVSELIISLPIVASLSILTFLIQIQKPPVIRKIALNIYNKGVFPFSIGFAFIFIMLLEMEQINSEDIQAGIYLRIWIICKLCCMIGIAFVFFQEWKVAFTKQSYNKKRFYGLAKCSRLYIPIYLTYNWAIFTIIFLGILEIISRTQEIILILALIAIILILCYRPYKQLVHNIGIFVNTLLIFLFATWMSLRQYLSAIRKEENEILIIFVVLSLIISCIIISVIRLFRSYKGAKQSQKVEKADLISQNIEKGIYKKQRKLNENEINIRLDEHMQIERDNLAFLKDLNSYSHFNDNLKTVLENINSQNRARLLMGRDILYSKEQYAHKKTSLDKYKRRKIAKYHVEEDEIQVG